MSDCAKRKLNYKVFLLASFLPVLTVFAFMSLANVALASKRDLISRYDNASEKALSITLGKAEILNVEGSVADILVADPSVIDVRAIQSNRLYVVGLSIGDTNLIALDTNGDVIKKIDIHVTYDLNVLRDMVDDLFPNEKVEVNSVRDRIILTGSISTPQKASRLTEVIAGYVGNLSGDSAADANTVISNMLDVRGEQQVTLQVKIVEASRTVLKELGIETNANDPNNLATQNIFDTVPLTAANANGDSLGLDPGTGVSLSEPAAATIRFFRFSGLDWLGTIGVFINALEEQNLVNVLAEPNLTAISGEQAGFLAGGETPVPQGLDQLGNVVITFRPFGVSLNFRPIVLSNDRISLQMDTEVSSINFENAIPSGSIDIPGFDVRRASTTVEVPSGGSIMIAGLLQSEVSEGFSGIPGILNTPILGDLISSDSFQREETELLVIVTPYLVEPFSDEDRSDDIPEHQNGPLAIMFSNNIRRSYILDEDEDDLFSGSERYGYILE